MRASDPMALPLSGRALVALLPSPSSDALDRRDELVLGGLLLGTLVFSEEAEDDVAGGLVDLPLLEEPVDLNGAVPHGDLELARKLLQRRGERVEDSRRSGLLEPDLFREGLEVLDILAVCHPSSRGTGTRAAPRWS